MKSAHLIKNTHVRKQDALAGTDVQVFDFTDNEADDDAGDIPFFDLGAFSFPENENRALPHGSDEGLIAWCVAMAGDSPATRGLLTDNHMTGWSMALCDLHDGGFHIDFARRTITLDNFSMLPGALAASVYFRNEMFLSFVRALRDIWHENRCGAFEEIYMPEQVLMLERVRAADCDTLAVFAAWELRGAGYTDVWRHLLGAAEGDMAMMFARYLERDPASLYDGGALAYAFRQWYADHARVAACDHRTLEALDDILLSAETHNPFGQGELNAGIIENLSVLPDGICYMAGLGRTVMGDPYFAGMNDALNQTHLFHLMYDLEVTMVNNVPFRDAKLAGLIFPGAEVVRSLR